jgi:filamentous hemagglutinin family protein
VVLEWGSFNIEPNETTTFVQPNVDAWALNRVVGSQDPSVIAGTLNANGNIAIVNPDGIVFSHGSRVDVGGLVATTANIDNDAFMRGNLSFNLPGNPGASVINEGAVSIRDHGLAAFVAPGVRNSGVITARLGTVSLASGNTFALDLYGDGLVSLAIGDQITEEVIDVATGQPMADLVKNEGTISANGGTVALTAATARTAVNSVINNTGVIEANSVGMRNGRIILGAQTTTSRPATAPTQTVRVSGQIRATAVTTSLRPAARPGSIQITGEDIQIAEATIDASGTNGGGTVLIGGDYLGGQAISDLFPVGEDIREDYEVATAATVVVDNTTTINASATDNGDGGKIILWSDLATTTSADILAFGAGDGTGGFIETSSAGTLSLPEGYVSAGQGGIWLLDPEQLYVSNRDAVFGDTEYVDAATVEAALNAGTNVSLVSTGDDARTGINSQISKTAGGDATLSLGSTGSVSINANITSTSGELTVAVRTADTLEPFINGSLTGFRDGLLTISDATIETNGGGFAYRGAAFQMTNSIVSFGTGPASDTRPGQIRTHGGAMLFELSALPTGSSDASGVIGCNGFYEISCGQSASVLNAGSGSIVFRQNPNATTTNEANFPTIFVGDIGIETTGTLTLDGVNMRSERRTNRNSVDNIAFGTLALRNNAIIDFPFADAPGLETFYTPVVVSGVTLPTGTYVVGERIIIQLPTLFTSPNSPILSLDVFGPAGGTYQIIGNELVIEYNGNPGTIELTFRAVSFAGVATELNLSLRIDAPVVVPPEPPTNNPPQIVSGVAFEPRNGIWDQSYLYVSDPIIIDENPLDLTIIPIGIPEGLEVDVNTNGQIVISGIPVPGGSDLSSQSRIDLRIIFSDGTNPVDISVSASFLLTGRSGANGSCAESGTCGFSDPWWQSDQVSDYYSDLLVSAAGAAGTDTAVSLTAYASLLTVATNYSGQLALFGNAWSDGLGVFLTTDSGRDLLKGLKLSPGGLLTSAGLGIMEKVILGAAEAAYRINTPEYNKIKYAVRAAKLALAVGLQGPAGGIVEASGWIASDTLEMISMFREFEQQGGFTGLASQKSTTLDLMEKTANLLASDSQMSADLRRDLLEFLYVSGPDTLISIENIESDPRGRIAALFIN